MDKTIFNFDLLDKVTPEIVIENSLKQIKEATRGYVIGNIEEYDGPITSYKQTNGLAASLGAFKGTTETVNIQDVLGEQNREQHRYEVFLTTKVLEHYKYRMMFIDYGTISYPVTIVMNEALAIEFSGKINESFSIESMKELEDMMNMIISSDTMVALFQNLIYESLRQEAKPKPITHDVETETSDCS